MFKLPSRTVATLGSAILLSVATAPAPAQVVIDDDVLEFQRPPELLDLASATPSLFSSASARVDYLGSRRVPFLDCPGDSFNFWVCREADYFEVIFDSDSSAEGSVVSAEVRPDDFERTDTAGAGGRARAAADFRSLRGEAYADSGSEWTETRVTSANNPAQGTISARSRGEASALSRSVDMFVPSVDGTITLELALENHPGGYSVTRSQFPDNTPLRADGSASLLVQVFNLDVLTQYASLSTEFQPFDGFLLVGEAREGRDESDPPTRTFEQLVINVVAGQRYSIVSQLEVSADNDADMNLFGSGRLERILVEPGQSLAFVSGADYTIAVVPVPAALPLLLSGIGAITVAARRRRSAGQDQPAR
jgi:hypothetical protein